MLRLYRTVIWKENYYRKQSLVKTLLSCIGGKLQCFVFEHVLEVEGFLVSPSSRHHGTMPI